MRLAVTLFVLLAVLFVLVAALLGFWTVPALAADSLAVVPDAHARTVRAARAVGVIHVDGKPDEPAGRPPPRDRVHRHRPEGVTL